MKRKQAVPYKDSETKHLEMMRNPATWPLWPMLPLRHRNEPDPDSTLGLLGFMFEAMDKGQADPKVYVGCCHFRLMGKQLKDLPVREYADLEAVVAAGWEVN